MGGVRSSNYNVIPDIDNFPVDIGTITVTSMAGEVAMTETTTTSMIIMTTGG
jgi:hypothetical protein